jgi:hypothetical protein
LKTNEKKYEKGKVPYTRGICAGSDVKLCAKHAQNMSNLIFDRSADLMPLNPNWGGVRNTLSNPENGFVSTSPCLINYAILKQNMTIFLIRKASF